MKLKWIFTVLIALLFVGSGCDLDTFSSEEADVNLKSSELKMVPLKGEVYAVMTNLVDDLPTEGYIGGTISHVGEIIPDNSIFVRTDFALLEGPVYYAEFDGDVVASNGDILHYKLKGGLNLVYGTYEGHVDYRGGTGRFEFATGYGDLTGHLNMDGSKLLMWLEGELSNVGSSKKNRW